MRITSILPLTLSLLVPGNALAADGSRPGTGRLALGTTGIHCVTQPCPWRGIVDLEDHARDPLRPLWSGSELPMLAASEDDTVRLRDAWSDRECLVVNGRFDGKTLHVDDIVGICP